MRWSETPAPQASDVRVLRGCGRIGSGPTAWSNVGLTEQADNSFKQFEYANQPIFRPDCSNLLLPACGLSQHVHKNHAIACSWQHVDC